MGVVTHRRPCPRGIFSAILPAVLLCILASASHDRLADWHLHHRRKAPSYFEQSHSERGCLTYKERYAIAGQAINERSTVQGDGSVAVIIRFYAEQKAKDDLVNHLRTAIFETERRGYHAYIFYELKGERDHPEEVEAVREELPSDLRHYIIFWQKDDVVQEYPSLPAEAWQMGNLNGTFWGSGPTAAYLPLLVFMQEHQAYDFAWVLEQDVRFIGDWGLLLGSAYAVAAASKQDPKGGADFRQDLRNGFSEALALKSITNVSLPDLIAFHGIAYDSNKWANTALGLKRPFAESDGLQVWGGSRQLFDAMDRASRGGAFAYYEMFMPTVAVMNNLTIVGLPLTEDTYECCNTAGELLYRDWYSNEQSCQPYQLLHPIKLREELWVPVVMSPPWMSSW